MLVEVAAPDVDDECDLWAKRRRRAFVSTERSGVREPCTWALHCYFRSDKADSFVELGDAVARCAKDPRHSDVISHDCPDQSTTHAFPAVILGYDHHRNVAIGQPVAKRTHEADDLVILDRNESPLRSSYEVTKVACVRHAVGPPARLEETSG
jgi:hypothetical protein